MWRMLQIDEPGDYVRGTGVGNTVRDFLALAFDEVGLDWENTSGSMIATAGPPRSMPSSAMRRWPSPQSVGSRGY